MTFLEELHPNDVLEVLLVVGFKFLFYKIEKDKYYWKIHSKIKMIAYIKFYFNVAELYLDVLEVLLVGRFGFLSDKTIKQIPKVDSLKKLG